MTATGESSGLERSYRRTLRVLPRTYRSRHEDEIVSVLIDAAPPGRTRAPIGEVVSLIRLGLRIWLGRAVSPSRQVSFDAVSVLAVGLPVLLMFPAASAITLGFQNPLYLTATAGIPGWILWVMTAALAVGGKSNWAGRVAVAAVVASLAGEIFQLADHNFRTFASDLGWVGVQLVAAAALANPDRVLRGRALIRPWQACIAALTCVGLGVGYALYGRNTLVFDFIGLGWILTLAGAVVALAVGIGMLFSALGRAMLPIIGALAALWWAAKDQSWELANFEPVIPSWFTVSPSVVIFVMAVPAAVFLCLRLLTAFVDRLHLARRASTPVEAAEFW